MGSGKPFSPPRRRSGGVVDTQRHLLLSIILTGSSCFGGAAALGAVFHTSTDGYVGGGHDGREPTETVGTPYLAGGVTAAAVVVGDALAVVGGGAGLVVFVDGVGVGGVGAADAR